MKPAKTGITRIIHATGYSLAGLRQALQHEAAFRQELFLCVILMPLAFFLGDTFCQRTLLLASCFIVLITEILNSAIEAVVDKASPERNPLAGRAKDMGSAAVFLSLLQLICIWTLFILDRFFTA